MKSGLLTLLACPICKHYPLRLKIFEWETKQDKFKQLLEVYTTKNIEILRNETNVKIIKSNGEIKIKDNIVRYEKNLNDYIDELKEIHEDLLAIQDVSKILSNEILKIIKEEFFVKLEDFKKEDTAERQEQKFEQFKLYIYIANWYLFNAEINEGIMTCDKCQRWFPIIETIPQMLPDEVRKEKKDVPFLQKWKDDIEDWVLFKGKPFNLKENMK